MPEQQPETVTITLDGKDVDARHGELLIAAAERHGVYIPRFCWHPRMREVGMCRMCLVDIDTGRGPALQPACMAPVAEGMKVDTANERVAKAQDGVLEFLLINHPLDCPVCDKGGECPLQDQTLAFGPGETRFVEEKRHFPKPIPISSLVYLDRERCILCDRCTRFADEVAGDPLITFVGRGNHTQVNTFPDDPFASYFSGNTVQICPVGALTAKPYRFRARPWDLEQVESTCTSCSVGCRVAVQSSQNRILRYLGIDLDPVNWGWLCDKGRFDFEAVNSDERLGEPLVRRDGELVTARWGEAVGAAAEGLRQARDLHGPGAIAVLGGARSTNEDAYTWAKLAKGVLGTDNVDAQLGDGLPAELVLGLPRATIDEACTADTLVLLGPDLKEELPVLYLRIRDAVMNRGLRVLELAPHDTGMTRYADVSLRYRPGEAQDLVRTLLAGTAVSPPDVVRGSELLRAGGTVACALGRPSLAESHASVVDAAAALAAEVPGITFLSTLRRANVHGALDMGLAPGVLPGRIALDTGREWFSGAWGSVPAERGLDATGILQAAAEGRIHGLVLVGADPLADFPDRDLARRALTAAGFVVAVDCFLTESCRQADVVLAAAGYAEKPGTTTNLEGRVTLLNQKVTPPGTARADWMIAADLALRLGSDLGFDSIEAISAEIERMAASHAGITSRLLHSLSGLDGIVVPLAEHVVGPPSTGAAQTEEPGVIAAESHMGADTVAVSAGETDTVAASGQSSGTASGDRHAEDSGEGDAPDITRPPLITFGAPVRTTSPPPVDSYSLRLVSGRKLYDEGTLTRHSPSLAPLAPAASLRVSQADLDRLGLRSGDRVRLTSSRTSLTIEAIADDGVPKGVAVLPFNLPGTAAAELVDFTSPITDVRVETVRPGDAS